jgi:signal transduction histidine kinase
VAAYVDVIKKIEFFWLQVARLPKKRINMLLIEDNPGDVRLVEEMLKEGSGADFELKTSTSLREGMRLIEDDHVDIVVLDLNLPDSTSYETFAKLYSRFPRLPIVVITGIKDDSLGIKAVKEGAQSYLSKQDLTPEFLIKTIRYSIERIRLKLAYEDLMHIILHEIRSPLAIIKEGASQMLDGIQGKLSGKQREYAEMVFDNGQRMERLINDLLEIAKIEIGTMKLETKRFDMAQLIRRTATGLKAVTDKKGLKLITSILEPKIEVVADPDRITQVIHNLISNAIKCTEKGEIVISLGADADNVECSVKDTGAGVDPALLPRIFDKYKQGGHGVQRSKGVGLGLFLWQGDHIHVRPSERFIKSGARLRCRSSGL